MKIIIKDYLLCHLIKTNDLMKCEIKMNLKNEMKNDYRQNRF